MKYNIGDKIGPYQIELIERLYKDKHNQWHGKFKCPCEHSDGKVYYFEGNIATVAQGKKKNCGCKGNNKAPNDNIIGNKFGRLTVLKKTNFRNNNKEILYECECDCKNKNHKMVTSHSLKSGLVQSCGCLAKEKASQHLKQVNIQRRKDLAGQKSGTWTAIKRLDKTNISGNYYWLCECENGHINEIDTGNWGKITTCRQCGISKGEILISNILTKLQISFETEYTFLDCKYERPLRFDFYLPDYNCCIEYDGIQHFKETTFSHDNFETRQIRDNIKDEYCKMNDIALIRISYKDYNNIDKQYLLDKIKNI